MNYCGTYRSVIRAIKKAEAVRAAKQQVADQNAREVIDLWKDRQEPAVDALKYWREKAKSRRRLHRPIIEESDEVEDDELMEPSTEIIERKVFLQSSNL